jgi:phosphoserine phosphatase RsbU/P
MQQRLLPPSALQATGVRCEWRLEPSGYVAGDIFNFFVMDEHRIGFYLLDVSGHGVPAAMLSVTLSMMLTPEATDGSPLKHYDNTSGLFKVTSPGDVIRELNKRFQSKDDRYFTMVYGLLDTRTSTVGLAQAGHPGPILMKENGELYVLGTGGMPVGLWPNIDFDCFDTTVSHGDRLLLYSDGVTECVNIEEEAFGEDRLLSYLKRCRGQPLDVLLGGLLKELSSWRSAMKFVDDVSLLAIEVN